MLLAEWGATDEMVGCMFNCDGKTVRRRFGNKLDEARQRGKTKLWVQVQEAKMKRVREGSDKMIMYMDQELKSRLGITDASVGNMFGDVNNILIQQYAKLPPEQLTREIDLLTSGEQEGDDNE